MAFIEPDNSVTVVWSRFKGKRPLADGRVPSFRVQNCTEDIKEDVINFMFEVFAEDEVACKATNLKSCPKSLKLLDKLWRDSLKPNVALVCVIDEDLQPGQKPVIAGVNITSISRKSDKPDEETENWNDIPFGASYGAVVLISKMVDVYQKYDVDVYMTAIGLAVRPEFRGQNIGGELLNARVPLMKSLGIVATATVFTGIASQKLAEKAGYELLAEVLYEDMLKKHGLNIQNVTEKSSKYMGKRI